MGGQPLQQQPAPGLVHGVHRRGVRGCGLLSAAAAAADDDDGGGEAVDFLYFS